MPHNWSDPAFLSSVYTYALLILGVVFIAVFVVKKQIWHGLPKRSVTPWHIGWTDLNILFCLLVGWAMLVGPATNHILPLGDNPTPAREAWSAVLSGGLLQAGMAIIFIVFWFSQPYAKRPNFNMTPMGLGSALGTAIVGFLLFIPPRFGVEMGWMALLKWLNSLGLGISTEAQEVTGFFNGAPPLAYILLIFLAGFVAPVVEELVFRAGLYRFLKGQAGKTSAMIISSAVFAVLHWNVLVFPTLMLFGVALCLAYESSGNLKVPIAFHALFNLNTILLIALQGAPVVS
jgi:membrane protease YdiL (CAAX protease family)